MRRVTENKKIIYISQYFPVFPTLRVLDRAVFPGKYRPENTAPVFPGQHCNVAYRLTTSIHGTYFMHTCVCMLCFNYGLRNIFY